MMHLAGSELCGTDCKVKYWFYEKPVSQQKSATEVPGSKEILSEKHILKETNKWTYII